MDLNNLFKWKKELIIVDANGEPYLLGKKPLKLYQRIIGDADLIKARTRALRASKTLRERLRDENSEEFAALIPDYKEQPDETLANMVIFAEGIEIRRRAVETAKKPKEPKKPKEDAPLEDFEEYEAAIESHKSKIEEAITERMNDLIEKRLKELKKAGRDEIIKTFLIAIIDSLCRTEMLRIFNSWCTYLGTYADKQMTTKAFDSFENFDNSATELKNQIIGGYLKLEITGEELKN